MVYIKVNYIAKTKYAIPWFLIHTSHYIESLYLLEIPLTPVAVASFTILRYVFNFNIEGYVIGSADFKVTKIYLDYIHNVMYSSGWKCFRTRRDGVRSVSSEGPVLHAASDSQNDR